MEKANTSNKSKIINILSKAFDTNKSVNWVVKNDKRRELRIRSLMNYAFDLCKQDGVFVSEDCNGAIIFDFPKASKNVISKLIQDIKFIFNVIGAERLFKVLKREAYIKKFHPKENYIYLWFLGVNPDYQGKGIGSKLLEELLEISGKKGLSVYLETSNPLNLEFYKKFGFNIYHEWNSEFIGFPIWFMRKD